jgi:hypothetical protein
VHARTARLTFSVAGLTAILAAALAGCGSSTSAPASPLSAVKLAAKITSAASTVAGTMSIKSVGTVNSTSADETITASFMERIKPALLANIDIESIDVPGESIPGGLNEIVTPSTFYLKWSYLTKQLNLTKPWIEISVAQASKSTGLNLSALFAETQNNGPLTQSQMLAGASSVRRVGTSTGSGDGVSLTEYTGTYPLSKGLKYLTGTAQTQLRQEIAAAGLTTAKFTVWIDSQNLMRKMTVIEEGKTLTETITMAINSINQPVTIQIPAASQISPLPSGL